MSTTATTAPATTFVRMRPTMPETETSVVEREKSCPTCGQEGVQSGSNGDDAQARIAALEGEVETLNGRAKDTGMSTVPGVYLQRRMLTNAAQKLDNYEEEIQRLRSQQSDSPSTSPTATRPTDKSLLLDTHSQQQHQQQSRLGMLTSLLRRPSATPSSPAVTSPPESVPPVPSPAAPPDTTTLQNALNKETNLRKAAESQLSQANSELEDLTSQLFSQANEMVAQERRARVRLEERVAVLERRDGEKGTRLERLEKAMERVERLRKLVG